MRLTMPGIAIATALFAVSSHPAAAQESSYTRHAYQSCKAASSPEPGVIELRRCQGQAGIPVTWTSEPDSSSVGFGDRPDEESLDIGSAFEVGSTIEWRSAGAGKDSAGKRPVAAIVRYKVGDSVGKLNASRLVVYRIEASGRSCVMGVVAGGDANARARIMVDRSAAGFVCGTSKRLER